MECSLKQKQIKFIELNSKFVVFWLNSSKDYQSYLIELIKNQVSF